MKSWVLALSSLLVYSACQDDPVDPPAPSCSYDVDCPGAQVCKLGQCFGTATCVERSQCRRVPVCAGDTCICDVEAQRCLPVCETDDTCPSDGQCVNGRCTKYIPVFGSVVPGGAPKKPLEIGIGRADLNYPMGVSLAAYATRRGPETPYRASLGGSNSWFDRPDVRAIVLDNAEDMLILLRLPLAWSDDFLIVQAALDVQKRTGLNVLDKIMTSAPHSHSHPARFWHMVVGLNFGIFGYDEFSWEIFDRISKSLADAIVDGLENRRPGRFGWTVIDDFDPDDQIHRDRRPHNDGLPGETGKDKRMLLMRFDDVDGRPLALATHFGIHGTVFDANNPMITGDAPGGVETILQKRAQAKYGTALMGVFLQGNAGDISPAGDDLGHPSIEQIQLVGERVWAVAEAAFDRIVTKTDIDVDVMNARFPISREALGYSGNMFRDDNLVCENTPSYFRYGSFQCLEGLFNDADPATKFTDGALNCVFAVECLTDGYPVPQFMKGHVSLARLGDLALSTIPGEPLSKFGMDNARAVKAALPSASDAFSLGYSQEHHFYLMTEDDWFQGGYEPSRDIWGWRLAPYFLSKSAGLAAEMAKPRSQRVSKIEGNVKPMFWDKNAPGEKVDGVPWTETEGDPAAVTRDVPSRVERLARVDFGWTGGHPGLDLPHVFLEQESGGVFTPVTRPGGDAYRDGGFEMIVRYEGNCDLEQCRAHRWAVRWEEARDFPLGRYRFSVRGKALKAGRPVEYATTSSAFEMVPSTGLELYGLTAAGDGIDGRVLDPRAVRFDTSTDGTLTAVYDGHRLRSMLGSGANGTPLPLDVTVTATGSVVLPSTQRASIRGTSTLTLVERESRSVVTTIAPDGTPERRDAGMQATTRFHIPAPAIASGPPGAYRVTIQLTDSHGNSGTTTATVTK